jgi:hypothetical protein
VRGVEVMLCLALCVYLTTDLANHTLIERDRLAGFDGVAYQSNLLAFNPLHSLKPVLVYTDGTGVKPDNALLV